MPSMGKTSVTRSTDPSSTSGFTLSVTGFDPQVEGRATPPAPGAGSSQHSLIVLFLCDFEHRSPSLGLESD